MSITVSLILSNIIIRFTTIVIWNCGLNMPMER